MSDKPQISPNFGELKEFEREKPLPRDIATEKTLHVSLLLIINVTKEI